MRLIDLFRRSLPEELPPADPLEEVMSAIDHLNSLVSSLPRGIGLWIDYTPGPRKGTVILCKCEFAPDTKLYPEREVDRVERHVRTRARKDSQ